jgi:phospholipid-binding lipoprotein MlaA
MVNYVLQARFGHAARTLGRFAINSTVGLVGVIDVAKKDHLPHHDNSFGTTLGRWGFQPGPYIFLPLVGPSTLRDGFGSVVDIGFDPLTYTRFPHRTAFAVTMTVIDGLGARLEAQPELDSIQQTSTDPYATLRSYYLQNRQAEISGKPVSIDTLPEFDTLPNFDTPAPEPAPPTGPPVVSQPRPEAPPAPLSGAAASPPLAVPDPPVTPPVSPPGPTP